MSSIIIVARVKANNKEEPMNRFNVINYFFNYKRLQRSLFGLLDLLRLLENWEEVSSNKISSN